MKKLFNFTEIQGDEGIRGSELRIKTLKAEGSAESLLAAKDLETQVFRDKLRLNIVQICLSERPYFVEEFIILKLLIDQIPHGLVQGDATLSRLDKATQNVLISLRTIFNQIEGI